MNSARVLMIWTKKETENYYFFSQKTMNELKN